MGKKKFEGVMGMAEEKKTRTLEQIQDEIRSYLGEIEYLRSQVGVIDATITDLRTVDATLAYLKEKGKGKEIYIPLGSGVAIRGKIENPRTMSSWTLEREYSLGQPLTRPGKTSRRGSRPSWTSAWPC